PPEFLEASLSFLAMDAPRHTKLRGLVSSAFTPRQVARIEEGIRVNARRIVAEAAPTGGGDFVELIAKRLPLVTIPDMIGVRWASPVLTFRRTTTREIELHGTLLQPGERVVLFYHSANRDEQAFEHPWRFDVTRDPNRHLGFGGGGPHYCLGASLARTQLRS